jgi:hypothetical protein
MVVLHMLNMNTPYTVDQLIGRLRQKWADLNVSPEAFAQKLAADGRQRIHFNTLAKLGAPDRDWSPSRNTLRDLEDVLIINPLNLVGVRPKRQRKPRATPVQAAGVQQSATPSSSH